MAAPPSKPSPSSQPVASSEAKDNAGNTASTTTTLPPKTTTTGEATAAKAPTPETSSSPSVTLKDPPLAPSTEKALPKSEDTTTAPAAAAATPIATTTTSLKDPPPPPAATTTTQQQQQKPAVLPTFETSEQSPYIVVARASLNEGRFEEALAQIEEGLVETQQQLQKQLTTADEDVLTFHPAMAPFHYWYGTTLLYSIEETADAVNNSAATGGGDADVDEMEIAWENLELGRNIIERYCSSEEAASSPPATAAALQLQLSQIYLRCADLHRMNGRHVEAVRDYESCLQLRTTPNINDQQQPLLGPYDRKIADVHYNLGLVHMLIVAKHKQEQQDGSNAAAPPPPVAADSAAAAAAAAAEPTTSTTSVAHHRALSFYHYWSCARTLSGQIALLCGQDPDEFLRQAAAAVPPFKTTGEENDELPPGVEDPPALASWKLKTLRERIAQVLAPLLAATNSSSGNDNNNNIDQDKKQQFDDLCELLQEIQETMDEAESSVEGVHQVSEMKAQIAAAAAAEDAGGAGATSSIGFATASTGAAGPTAGSTTTIGFGPASSSSAAAATVVAQPVMAVKKKKKRPAPVKASGKDGDDSMNKKTAADPSSKRPKSE